MKEREKKKNVKIFNQTLFLSNMGPAYVTKFS